VCLCVFVCVSVCVCACLCVYVCVCFNLYQLSNWLEPKQSLLLLPYQNSAHTNVLQLMSVNEVIKNCSPAATWAWSTIKGLQLAPAPASSQQTHILFISHKSRLERQKPTHPLPHGLGAPYRVCSLLLLRLHHSKHTYYPYHINQRLSRKNPHTRCHMGLEHHKGSAACSCSGFITANILFTSYKSRLERQKPTHQLPHGLEAP